jgi:Caspase domain
MPRPAEAILFSLTETQNRGDTPASADSAMQVRELLRAQLGATVVLTERGNGTTCTQALQLIRAASTRLQTSQDALLVISFAGHGAFNDGYHSWIFEDGELSDTQLANALSALPASAEIVIISDCCYGSGMLRPGFNIGSRFMSHLWSLLPRFLLPGRARPHPDDLHKVRTSLRALTARVSRAASDGSRLSPESMRRSVCIAATNLVLVRATSDTSTFARCLRGAMARPSPPASYDTLDDAMGEVQKQIHASLGQESWRVEAEPIGAGTLKPFRQ